MSLSSLDEFIKSAIANDIRVVILQHWEQEEIAQSKPRQESQHIRTVAADNGIIVLQLGPMFKESMMNGVNPYLDNLHPSRQGHKIIADVIMSYLSEYKNDLYKEN